jgi:methyl-accepting chemotaxis protein
MAIVLIGTLVFLLSVQVTRPLAAVSAVIRDIANGEIDGEIPHTGRMDEVGRISQSLMVLKRNEGERRRLARESEEETSQRQIRQQATEALISEFRVAISQSLEELNSTMTQMNCASEELGEIAENTSKGVLVVSKASEEANVGFQTIAGTTEEISMSVNEIFGLMGETQQVVSSAVTNVEQANDKVIKLTSAAEKIGNVVSLIMEIAEQTNLLALNATIEAARAGEAGKGFAVVASEVKALAIQTAKATEEISSQIETIQSSTEDSVRAIQSISETLDKVNEYTSSVSAAIEEQGTAMTEISRSTGESAQNSSIVSRNIENVSDSASKTRDSAQLVRDASVRLNSQSSRMSETIDAFLKAVAAA